MKLAIFQPEARPASPRERLQSLATALAENADPLLDLVLCPELFISGYGDDQAIRKAADSLDGQLIEQLSELATHHAVAIACGYPEIVHACGGTLYNSVICISAQGRRLANHRKRVLPTAYERALFSYGTHATMFSLDNGWRVALLICYEVEFPEAVRACALAGARLVLVPTALGGDWQVISRQVVPSRAIENCLFLAYANFAGEDQSHCYLGDSVIVSPMGVDLARAGPAAEFISAQLDAQAVDRARERLAYLKDYPRVT